MGSIKLRRYFESDSKPLTLSSLTKVGVLPALVQTGEESGWRRVGLGTLPVNPPLILSRKRRTESSTPSSRDSTWNGKTAPSTYLHKQLNVTNSVTFIDLPQLAP